jgi:hypothetical protein
MEYITLKQFKQKLSKHGSCDNLKYFQYCLTRRGKTIAWLMPVEEKPEIILLEYIRTADFKSQVSYHVNRLIISAKEYPPTQTVGFGLLAPGSEHICNLLVR